MLNSLSAVFKWFLSVICINSLAEKINSERLHALKEDFFTHEGKAHGDFKMKHLPAHEVLDLKIGARVMLLNNDPEGRWVNGSIGKITDIFNAGFDAMAVVGEFSEAGKWR